MIAVTGANGLLGEIIVSRLKENGEQVIKVVRQPGDEDCRRADVDDPQALCAAFEGVQTVVHAAGLVSFNPRRKKELFRTNVEGTANVVNAALRTGVKNLIHVSSVAAFPRPVSGEVVTEHTKPADSKANFPSYYGFTKYLAELEAFRGGEEGLQVAIVNPAVVLAPSLAMRSSARTFEYVLKEKPFYTHATLNYVDGRDVAQAIALVLRAMPDGQRFLLCGGNARYIDFFESVARQLNKRAPYVRVGHKLIWLAAAAEELRAFALEKEPLITRPMANSLRKKIVFDASDSMAKLGLQYRSLEDTVNWCCGFYREHINAKY